MIFIISHHLKIRNVEFNCLPEDQLEYIKREQNLKHRVAMIGDGINDAPSLKKANVGIAMGEIGSEISIEAANIALINDNIEDLPHLIAIAKKTIRTININIAFSLILNIIAKNKIDVFSINSLYTNTPLVVTLEISTGLFLVWVGLLIIAYTTNCIIDRIVNRKEDKLVMLINRLCAAIKEYYKASTQNNSESFNLLKQLSKFCGLVKDNFLVKGPCLSCFFCNWTFFK